MSIADQLQYLDIKEKPFLGPPRSRTTRKNNYFGTGKKTAKEIKEIEERKCIDKDNRYGIDVLDSDGYLRNLSTEEIKKLLPKNIDCKIYSIMKMLLGRLAFRAKDSIDKQYIISILSDLMEIYHMLNKKEIQESLPKNIKLHEDIGCEVHSIIKILLSKLAYEVINSESIQDIAPTLLSLMKLYNMLNEIGGNE